MNTNSLYSLDDPPRFYVKAAVHFDRCRPKGAKFLVAILALLGASLVFLPADATSDPFLPGSQPDLVAVQRQGDRLVITVCDLSVITKLRRVVGRTSELTEMVRVVTRQSDLEGWETILVAGHLPGSWQTEDGYFEECYVILHKSGGVWEGSIGIFPTPTLDTLYVCEQGWYEDAMVLGIPFNEIPFADASAAVSGHPEGTTLVVSSNADSGTGTLRWALETARSGDVITFDPAVFPPDDPATIYPLSALPAIACGGLTIDAGNAGVIIDGTRTSESERSGLVIVSNSNVIQGLQIVNCYPGAGMHLEDARNNTIGGSRSTGVGLTGQGNLLSGNGNGITLSGPRTSSNTIAGNLIGTNVVGEDAWPGKEGWGNYGTGIYMGWGASHNVVGPGNVIAHNREEGVQVYRADSLSNTITRNSIHSNGVEQIYLSFGGNGEVPPPHILGFSLDEGTIDGVACSRCTVEVFSQIDGFGLVFEGVVTADETGQVFVSPYNDPEIVAGQGSVAVEMLAQRPALDAVFVAVGGGGLIGGIGSYCKTKNEGHGFRRIETDLHGSQPMGSRIQVIGCLPQNSPVMLESVRAGRIVEMESLPTLSDGTAGGIEPGAITFDICRAVVDDWLTVSEEEIAAAMGLVYAESGEIIEGAAGVAVAALLQTGQRFAGQTVGVVICGGNIDEERFGEVIGQ